MTKAVNQPRRLGRPPTSEGPGTRERIIHAARECFARYGYDKTTNDDIAKKAGITSGAMYHYFDSKQDLFETVTTETLAEVLGRFRSVLRADQTFVEKIAAILEMSGDLNEQDPSLAAFVSTSPIEVSRHAEFQELAAVQMGETLGLFEEIVVEAKERGEVATDLDVVAVANMLMATTVGIALFAAFVDDQAAHRAILAVYEQLWRSPGLSPERREGDT